MSIVLASPEHSGVRNVMTAAWSMLTSFDPPLILVSIGMNRFTHDLIMKSREFAINIASDDQMDWAIFCGNVSGRELDKFTAKDIPIRPATRIGAPLFEGCVATIECRVRSYFLTGDHTVFVGETIRYDEDSSRKPLVRFRGMFFGLSESLGVDEHKSKV
jgi:flavin reductase (DIM6/NTAB) family NADH-FMN oxidoreductase RutF